ncbi:BMP family ABC transporter substrate-binding protein [Tistrella mobilis]
MRIRAALTAAMMALGLMSAVPAPADAAMGIKGDPKVAFIYIAPVGDLGWTWAHDQSRKAVEKELGVQTAYTESIPEVTERVSQVIDRYVGRGFNIIVGTAFGYSDAFKEAAARHPEVVFMNAAGYTSAPNLASYYGKSYESLYLAGMAAGYATKSNKLGFVAAYPLGLVLWNANAFALGARSVNPAAEVAVSFTNTWYDPVREEAAAKALIEQGADVIGQHQDTPGPQIAAERAGVKSIGYNADMSSSAPNAHIMAATWNWGAFVVPQIKKAIAGTFEGGTYFEGLETGLVDISAFTGTALTDDQKAKILETKAAIAEGKLDIWKGPIKDQNGKVVVADGATLDTAQLFGMDFLVEGTSGTLPK